MAKSAPIYSMTGFGRGRFTSDKRRITVDIRSVNNRYLELQIKGNGLAVEAESALSRFFKESLQRGSITVVVGTAELQGSPVKKFADLKTARAYHKLYAEVADHLHLDQAIIGPLILAHPEVIRTLPSEQADSSLVQNLLSAAKEALTALNRMRLREGSHMVNDLKKSLVIIDAQISRIEKLAPLRIRGYEERLRSRLDALLSAGEEQIRMRLAAETALMADKMDVSEEISRLRSHLGQFRKTLQIGGGVGKGLNFLLQEINREANTLSAKAQDAEIVGYALVIKEENEKMREMIQNLE
ncbi:MAG: YicC family protein [Elusimicrobia bacterium RIFOXYB2_FULL_49_7]|nr:MAG: YicC family protein [Elusimicrobia bacterium RIFOXYB2_FULL_49_7]